MRSSKSEMASEETAFREIADRNMHMLQQVYGRIQRVAASKVKEYVTNATKNVFSNCQKRLHVEIR